MIIIIDTREQLPYSFSTPTLRLKLAAGDYSLQGFEERVAVERKSLPDFVSTVIRARYRFGCELRKLATYDFACIVVEASVRDVLEGHYPVGAHPNAVLGTVLSICIDHRVPVFFCGDRQAACRFVEGYLERCWRIINERHHRNAT